jgi:hypothetical protein
MPTIKKSVICVHYLTKYNLQMCNGYSAFKYHLTLYKIDLEETRIHSQNKYRYILIQKYKSQGHH